MYPDDAPTPAPSIRIQALSPTHLDASSTSVRRAAGSVPAADYPGVPLASDLPWDGAADARVVDSRPTWRVPIVAAAIAAIAIGALARVNPDDITAPGAVAYGPTGTASVGARTGLGRRSGARGSGDIAADALQRQLRDRDLGPHDGHRRRRVSACSSSPTGRLRSSSPMSRPWRAASNEGRAAPRSVAATSTCEPGSSRSTSGGVRLSSSGRDGLDHPVQPGRQAEHDREGHAEDELAPHALTVARSPRPRPRGATSFRAPGPRARSHR